MTEPFVCLPFRPQTTPILQICPRGLGRNSLPTLRREQHGVECSDLAEARIGLVVTDAQNGVVADAALACDLAEVSALLM